MYGGNGHFQYSKGNNCKSRKTRVTVHVFCISSYGVNICVKFHENISSGFKVMEKTQKLLTDTHTHTQYTWYAGHITRVTIHVFCMSSNGLRFVGSFMKICQAVLKLWRRHKNC